MSDDSMQDASTTISHRKRNIGLLKKHNTMSNTLITIWENTDGCTEKYICATALYLISMFPHAFHVIIDHIISAPVHDI